MTLPWARFLIPALSFGIVCQLVNDYESSTQTQQSPHMDIVEHDHIESPARLSFGESSR
jgi:hypothetical protein